MGFPEIISCIMILGCPCSTLHCFCRQKHRQSAVKDKYPRCYGVTAKIKLCRLLGWQFSINMQDMHAEILGQCDGIHRV